MERAGDAVVSRVRSLRRALLINDVLTFLFWGSGLFSLAAFLSAVFFLSGATGAVFLAPLVYLAVRRLTRRRLVDVGYLLERSFPQLRGRLVSAMELARYQGGVEGYSLELRDAALTRVFELLEPLPLKRALPVSRVLGAAGFAVAAVCLLAGYLGFGGIRARLGLLNAFAPGKVRVEFEVAPQDTAVVSGTPVLVTCRVRPAGVFRRVALEMRGGAVRRRTVPVSGDSCVFSVVVKRELGYRFRALGKTSGWYRLGVVEPLLIRWMVFHCRAPAYTGLKQQDFTGAELAVLKGTRVEIEAQASQALAGGRLVSGADTHAVVVDQAQPERFSAGFTVDADQTLEIELAPRAGRTVQKVGRVQVRALADEPPFVEVFMPGRDVDLPMSMRVPLGINSLDDYGLNELWLHYGKESISEGVRLKRLGGAREDTTFYVWDLSGAGLVPGEMVRYYVRVTDNDAVSGPKAARSAEFTVRFPTMTEIYSATVEQTRATAERLSPLRAKQERLTQAVTRLAEEVKRTRELSWEEKKSLEGLLNEQQQLLAQVQALEEEAARAQRELLEGMNWDERTQKRLRELQEILSRLLPEELQEALRELAQKLESNAPALRQALERVQKEQDKLAEAIERALKMLKRLLEEERLEALAREARELERAQAEVSQGVERYAPEELARRQEAINAGVDSVQKEVERLAQEMSEPAVAESLAALGREMEQAGVAEMAQGLRRLLGQGERREAGKRSAELQGTFRALAERLERMSEGLKQRRAAELLRRLVAGAEALLAVSEKEEALEARIRSANEPAGLAEEQIGLFEATRVVAESIAALGAEARAVTPELGQELARTLNRMKSAAEALAQGEPGSAREQLPQARAGLNRAAGMVLEAAQNVAQGGGMKGGLEGLLEQLAQLTAEQMAVNAGMSGLPIPVPVSGLSAEQRMRLEQLLAQQRAVREALERLLQSMAGQRPGLTGRLDALAGEMRAVERALSELQIDRRLIERQQGILAHLLDAQRSLRQQGFKEERQAETAKEFPIPASPNLPADAGERNRQLRAELLRALKQGYPAEYERLIRAYFEKLLEER